MWWLGSYGNLDKTMCIWFFHRDYSSLVGQLLIAWLVSGELFRPKVSLGFADSTWVPSYRVSGKSGRDINQNSFCILLRSPAPPGYVRPALVNRYQSHPLHFHIHNAPSSRVARQQDSFKIPATGAGPNSSRRAVSGSHLICLRHGSIGPTQICT